ncbi:MAG: peptidyl-prolyl cis-trans isomerase [Phycisphaeraceae bacterium]|nr:peptidyl-prolyl cis-trans isomerase [Phycisphaeraceae bacterium]
MRHPTPLTTAALLVASLTLVGCESTWLASGGNEPPPVIQPEDFIGEPRANESGDIDQGTPVSTEETKVATNETADPAPNPRTDQALPVDAMVGHINGEAVYADQIFDVNLVAQLESFGRRFEGDEFRKAAGSVIQDRLQGIIINKLILGEAELNLKEAQRRGIEYRIQSEREELLRFYGQGSLAKAKAEFRKERDKELDQHLVDFREELVIGSYVRSKVMPKIVVNQRDVERYYADNIDKYQQPDQRVVRLIIAVDAAAAAKIQERLSKGQAFEKVAADPELNRYNPGITGLFNSGNPVSGTDVTNQDAVNAALVPLKSDQHAGPIQAESKTFFVQVVERIGGVKITLAQAQIGIEQKLQAAQFEKHALRFRLGLFKRGSYSDPAEMGNKLLEIATARYDQ